MFFAILEAKIYSLSLRWSRGVIETGGRYRDRRNPRKIVNHVTVHRPSDRPSAPQTYQCKITQSTGMATKMELEVLLWRETA